MLAGVAAHRREDQTLVGFAAEHGAEAVDRAREKLERKGVDLIVFNDVSRSEIGFDSEQQRGHDGRARRASSASPLAAKAAIAEAILDRVEALREQRSGSPG